MFKGRLQFDRLTVMHQWWLSDQQVLTATFHHQAPRSVLCPYPTSSTSAPVHNMSITATDVQHFALSTAQWHAVLAAILTCSLTSLHRQLLYIQNPFNNTVNNHSKYSTQNVHSISEQKAKLLADKNIHNALHQFKMAHDVVNAQTVNISQK